MQNFRKIAMQNIDKIHYTLGSQLFYTLFHMSGIVPANCDVSTNSQKYEQTID